MKTAIAPVKNIKKLAELGTALQMQNNMLPGIAVASGDSGIGKSTGLTWLSTTKLNAVYVRAMQLWSPSSMLRTIATELDIDPPRQLDDMTKAIVAELSRTGRPLIVDEADYVVDQTRLLNALRDLHDLSTMPLILVGMGEFVRKLRARLDQKQFTGRVALELEFSPLDRADVKVVADTLTDIKLDEELMQMLVDQSQGITRLVCVGLARIEAYAKKHNLKTVTAKQWDNQPLNLLSSRAAA